ncbi:diaminopimelate decarboxylase family protein [Amphritea pacifica]|uniref:Alanine racemase n=1 Tax=Amphritea pacifica TaxID=2811233 RepID=A0ABS2W5S8_9GAMM|nr:alanine racemase [Amphritea pacifica]MBN0987063.1 alanine racemase [Amphritea pacifica]
MSDATTTYLDAQMDKHQGLIDDLLTIFGQPLHIFFVEELARQVTQYQAISKELYSPLQTAFAVKSNPCRGALRAASTLGLGADCASEYELQAALQEGITGNLITCNGNAKTNFYLELAVENDALIVVDNADELDALRRVCQEHHKRANILLRFSGMPLAGFTADDQSTAADWTKFGFHIDEAEALFKLVDKSDELRFLGISAHIGTQLCKPEVFTRLFECLFALISIANRNQLDVSMINIGGGFPAQFIDADNAQQFQDRLYKQIINNVNSATDVTWNGLGYGFEYLRLASTTSREQKWQGKAYWTDYPGAAMLNHVLQTPMSNGVSPLETLNNLGTPRLIVEPGRSMMAPSGITVCEVMGTKSVMNHDLVMLDLGINNHSTNLIAPDMFPAQVIPPRPGDSEREVFLAGRLCFTGDMISKNKVTLNRLPERGDALVIYHTGGYSADHFASHNCGYPKPAKVAILQNGAVEIWREKESFVDVFGTPDTSLSVREYTTKNHVSL